MRKELTIYYVYIVKCADETLYTGIATELERRIDEHNSSDKGAKYTKYMVEIIIRLLIWEEYIMFLLPLVYILLLFPLRYHSIPLVSLNWKKKKA